MSQTRRFRIALSFAGDQRDYMAQVAERLAQSLGREQVLYDRFHEAEFAQPNLALDLPKLYHDEADLVVAVISPQYLEKPWCGLEWRACFGLIKQRLSDPQQAKRVMLMRFGLAEAEGLFGLAGYADLDDRSPTDAALLMLERLAVNEGLPRDRYVGTNPATHGNAVSTGAGAISWPEQAPALHWPVADHSAARDAFASLLTRDSTRRYLPILGPSGTGKTLLSNQFLGNVLHQLPDVRCARLDLKGSAGLGTLVQEWAEQLGAEPPPAQVDLLDQLKHVVNALKRNPLPTLLIFDTLEANAEVQRWLSESLLNTAIKSPWLRLVAIGQSVPRPEGKAWTTISHKTIELTQPSPADWLGYCHEALGRRDLTIEMLALIHGIVRGKPEALAIYLQHAAS